MPLSKGLTIAAAALACLGVYASAQAPKQPSGPAKQKAQYVGGFHPDACRYPSQERRERISACCIMDLDIGADGRVLASDGTCTHPAFLEATRRCMTAQRFVPATVNGQPVRAQQSMEYEWRAEGPAPTSLCAPLRTS
jgi:hypothetical protein